MLTLSKKLRSYYFYKVEVFRRFECAASLSGDLHYYELLVLFFFVLLTRSFFHDDYYKNSEES